MHKSSSLEIVFILILLLFTSPISFAEEQEANWTYAQDINEQSITWVRHLNETMKWGDRVDLKDWALGNFTVELTDLMKDATGSRIVGALMTVTGGNKKSQVAIGSDEAKIVPFDAPFYDDEMKIVAGIHGERTWSRELFEPNLSVEVFLRGKPDMNISINIYDENPESNADINNTDSIRSNKLFYMQIFLNNKGNATLENVLLDVNLTNLTIPREQLPMQRSGMSFKYAGNSIVYDLNDSSVNETHTLNLSLIPPVTPVNETFVIPVRLTGRDNKNVIYTFRNETPFILEPFIEVNKRIGPYVNYSGTDVLYVGESFSIALDIKNHGNGDTAIDLTDTVPDSFEYQTDGDESLNWTMTIPAKSSRTIMYPVKPVRYKENVSIPKATARFEFEGKKYSVDSNSIEAKMKGSEIILTKNMNINKQGNGTMDATITVSAENNGDQKVFLKINDSFPDGASLINGTTSMDGIFLEKNERYSYSYEILFPLEEKIILPAATGYFIDFRAYIEKDQKDDFWRKTESNQLVIEKQPEPAITPENTGMETPAPRVPIMREKRMTKLEIIKNFVLHFIEYIVGKEQKEETSRLAPQPEVNVRKIEETHSSLTWTLGWESQDNANASGGTWKISRMPGSKAIVSFTGTGAALHYMKSPEGGTAAIELDGEPYTDVDMYSPVEGMVNETVVSGLEDTRHTLVIAVSSSRNLSASGSAVVVDAVEIFEQQ